MRGKDSEPVELHPGLSAREAARVAEAEQWAWRRVRSLRAFYTHLSAYIVVNFVLFLIDSATQGPAWFYIPLTGWGLLVVLHALHAYEALPWTTQDWEQRKVRELVDTRLRR
ncbi:MAG: 2TM domain-containing protein [Stellaceae bacterium]